MMRLFTTKKNKKSHDFSMENNKLFLKELIKSFDGKRNPIQVFSAKELAKATCNYDPNFVIRREGFYVSYKGNYGASHNRAIIVHKYHWGTRRLIINELVVMSQINHKNVVKLLGCCLETELPILVFEYCHTNGTLADRIHLKSSGDDDGRRPLTWESRLRIATEIADAITYLHTFTSRPIIHRDINLRNIVLDQQDVARLFGFLGCILIPLGQTHVEDDTLAGSCGYLAPESVARNEVSVKADVYSFGIVLFEIFTGQSYVDFTLEEECDLLTYVKSLLERDDNLIIHRIVDPRIKEGGGEEVISDEKLQAYVNLAIRCTDETEDERPDMIQVAKELRCMWKSVQSS